MDEHFLCLNVKMCVPDGESYLWASSEPGAPVPAASAHCAACSPNHSLLSRWSPPAEGTLSYRSTRSWTQTLGGTAPPHLRGSEIERWSKRHTNTHIFRALALCSSIKLFVLLILNDINMIPAYNILEIKAQVLSVLVPTAQLSHVK